MRAHHQMIQLAAVACCLAMPAAAHHGWSGQGNELIEVAGTIHKPASLMNPHSTLHVMAGEQAWEITLPPAARVERAGLTAALLAVGTRVSVRGNRNNDAKRFEVKAVRVTLDGRNYDLYPERIPQAAGP